MFSGKKYYYWDAKTKDKTKKLMIKDKTKAGAIIKLKTELLKTYSPATVAEFESYMNNNFPVVFSEIGFDFFIFPWEIQSEVVII